MTLEGSVEWPWEALRLRAQGSRTGAMPCVSRCLCGQNRQAGETIGSRKAPLGAAFSPDKVPVMRQQFVGAL